MMALKITADAILRLKNFNLGLSPKVVIAVNKILVNF